MIRIIIIFFIYLYVITGIFISVKLFKNVIGKIIGAVYFGFLWLPILIADFIVKRLEKE